MEETRFILVTGASRGIGFDTVLTLLQQDHTQVLAVARDAQRLEQLRHEAGPAANRLRTLVLDLSGDFLPTLLSMLADWPHLDVLLNNAGVLHNQLFADTSLATWEQTFAVNLFAPVRLIQGLLPWLRRAGGAHIVNIGSMGGFQGSSKFPGLAAYSASKAALANLTECLAEELKADHISVNCLALGAVDTEMLQAAFPSYKAPLSSPAMAQYIARFCQEGHRVMNGKILPLSVSTP